MVEIKVDFKDALVADGKRVMKTAGNNVMIYLPASWNIVSGDILKIIAIKTGHQTSTRTTGFAKRGTTPSTDVASGAFETKQEPEVIPATEYKPNEQIVPHNEQIPISDEQTTPKVEQTPQPNVITQSHILTEAEELFVKKYKESPLLDQEKLLKAAKLEFGPDRVKEII